MTDAQILQMLGLAYLAIGLGILINPLIYKEILAGYMENLSTAYISGVIAFGIGFLLVSFRNVWVWDWPLVITIIGWIVLIKGLLMLVLPAVFLKIAAVFKRNDRFLKTEAVLIALFGFILSYLGFLVL